VVVRAKDEEEAIRIANDTPYGLSAAVFGRDVNRALRVARRLETGICHINGPTVHDEAQMPFGGVTASGYLLWRQGRHSRFHRTAPASPSSRATATIRSRRLGPASGPVAAAERIDAAGACGVDHAGAGFTRPRGRGS